MYRSGTICSPGCLTRLYWRTVDGVEDLERWAADARARDAADSRVKERWLRAQAEEDATIAGVLLAMAERREMVVVATAAGGAIGAW